MLQTLEKYLLQIRIAQGVLSVLILCLLAYTSSNWSWWWSPESINFMIFTSVWTCFSLVCLVLGATYFTLGTYKYTMLAVESTTMLFWFAGFIALTSFLTDVGCSRSKWGPCRASLAADIFSAPEWLLFMLTTGLAAFRTRTRIEPGFSSGSA